MNEGWKCPVCGNVYAPFVCACDYCNRNKSVPTTVSNETEVRYRNPFGSGTAGSGTVGKNGFVQF